MLSSVFYKINAEALDLEAMDPNTERFKKVESGMIEHLKYYREIYQEQKI